MNKELDIEPVGPWKLVGKLGMPRLIYELGKNRIDLQGGFSSMQWSVFALIGNTHFQQLRLSKPQAVWLAKMIMESDGTEDTVGKIIRKFNMVVSFMELVIESTRSNCGNDNCEVEIDDEERLIRKLMGELE